jgi:hypothetical protein
MTWRQRRLGDTFRNTKVHEVRQFIRVRRPVGGFARGEMVQVLAFHRSEDFSSSRRNEAGYPVSVLGVVVTAGEESRPNGAVEIRKLLLFEDVFGWKIDSRNG